MQGGQIFKAGRRRQDMLPEHFFASLGYGVVYKMEDPVFARREKGEIFERGFIILH